MKAPTDIGRQARHPPGGGTREQILTASSNLFAIRGYYGTTTREIAVAVGIRQPSLFHHFGSKASIMEALLDHDLARSVPARERIARSNRPAAQRLYRYVFDEVNHISRSPYNLAGVYTDEVRSSPEFERWQRRLRRLHRAIDRILSDGLSSGEFIDHRPDFIRDAILGILWRTLTDYSGGGATPEPSLADQIASFVLRALLVDIESLDQIRDIVQAEATSP